MTAWLLIALAAMILWVIWGVLNIIFNCIEYWHAARRREDPAAAEGKGS